MRVMAVVYDVVFKNCKTKNSVLYSPVHYLVSYSLYTIKYNFAISLVYLNTF